MTGSAGQKRIPMSFIKNFSFGLPPINEQKKILSRLNKLLTVIDKTIQNEVRFIDVLHELRTRLISDVVTGQIDVRNVVIPEYELVEEDISEDEFTDDELEISEVE